MAVSNGFDGSNNNQKEEERQALLTSPHNDRSAFNYSSLIDLPSFAQQPLQNNQQQGTNFNGQRNGLPNNASFPSGLNGVHQRLLRQQLNATHRQQSMNTIETASLHNFILQQDDNSRKAQVYESLDYEICENTLYLQENKRLLKTRQKRPEFVKYWSSFFANKKEFLRWIIIYFIGSLTALTACFIVFNVDFFSDLKFKHLQQYYDMSYKKQWTSDQDYKLFPNYPLLIIPLMYWIVTNIVPTLFGTVLVTYLAPVAAGSGIPVIKCYLNGVKVPEVVRIKTYIAKMFGVIGSVVGGLCSGKEGPMIHCGSVIAAGISQGKSTTFRKDFKCFKDFREDHEKRDFVSAGAAAGVAAAFGAPIGGVLFSLEEGASFWNQLLTWRIFFCSLISTFTLNLTLSTLLGKAGQLSYAGLINFGKIDNVNYNFIEIPFYIAMGIGGGLIGALFNFINYKLTIFRMRYIKHRPTKVLEAVFICVITAIVGFFLVLGMSECHSIDKIKHNNFVKFPVQLNCKENEFSTMGSLFINTPETVVINMLHMDAEIYSVRVLSIFIVVYFFLAVVTYGLSISSGLFIPALLIGGVYGRLVAVFTFDYLKQYCPDLVFNDLVTKFALIGAASVLGGIVRMTISLTVILIETTGNITIGFPLMICLILAKWIGDSFNEGIYDIHIRLAKIPFLNCEPHLNNHEIDEYETLFVSQIMSRPVLTLNKIEKVSNIIMILQNETYNGFPVVDYSDENSNESSTFYRNRDQNASFTNLMKDFENFEDARIGTNGSSNLPNSNTLNGSFSLDTLIGDEETRNDNYLVRLHQNSLKGNFGKLRGFVLRWQLIVLLEQKIFNENSEISLKNLNLDVFRDAYPRYSNIQNVISKLTPQEINYTIDLNHIMNPSPYSVAYNFTFNRTFRLFRALGLRHLCVVNDRNQVVGIITRKDIANFKVIHYKGRKYIQKYSDTLNDR